MPRYDTLQSLLCLLYPTVKQVYKYQHDTQPALKCKAVSPIQSFPVQMNVYATFLLLYRDLYRGRFTFLHLTTSSLLRTIFNQRQIHVKIDQSHSRLKERAVSVLPMLKGTVDINAQSSRNSRPRLIRNTSANTNESCFAV